jgi:AcrR family transcriptional regulator
MSEEIRLASRRERHKDARRARIIEAANDLMREVGADDISVKMIAERADVSAATIYNLFGAKGAVLEKVYERDFTAFAAKVAASRAKSALDAMFASIRIAADLYRSDPSFYRGMSIRDPRAEPELVISVQKPRQAFWQALLARAVAEGDLVPETRTDLLGTAMMQLGGGAFGAWVADLVSIDEMERQTCYGQARLLLGVATEAGRARLQARIDAIEAAAPASRDGQARRTQHG